MAKFIDLGVLWSPREGAKSLASGFVNREGIDALMDAWPKGEDQVRVFIQKIKSSTPRAPQYRITAVHEEGEVKERGHTSSRGRSESNDRSGKSSDRGERAGSSRGRYRDDRSDEKPTGFDREQGFKATDDDVPF